MRLEERHIFGARGDYRIDCVNVPGSAAAVRFRGVTKRYRRYRSDGQKFLMMFSRKLRRSIRLDTHLKDLDVTIRKGECVNVCGNYAAPLDAFGDILMNIVYPNFGTVWVNGQLSGVKAMKSGFARFLSASENIRRSSYIDLMTREEADALIRDIQGFTGLPTARMETPFGRLPQRAQAKIRSAYYLLSKHDILYMDEALPKVDKEYQEKCRAYLKAMLDDGRLCVIRRTREPDRSKLVTRTILFGRTGIVYDGDVKEARRLFKQEEARLLKREKMEERG
jgi:teichoic acid transport system ATP-binding protein